MLAHYLRINEWLRAEQGQDLVEFSLLIGLVGFGAIMILKLTGHDVSVLLHLFS